MAYLRRGPQADQPHYIMAAMRSGGGLAERGNDAIDHFLDQDAVVALTHHADHGLGAGRPWPLSRFSPASMADLTSVSSSGLPLR